jgi:hypothetical protein
LRRSIAGRVVPNVAVGCTVRRTVGSHEEDLLIFRRTTGSARVFAVVRKAVVVA